MCESSRKTTATVSKNGVPNVNIRRLLPILLLSVAASGLAATSSNDNPVCARVDYSNAQGMGITFTAEGLENRLTEAPEGSVDSYGIAGEGTTYEYGFPMLPAVSRFVVVPATAGLELVVQADEPRRMRAEHQPLLCRDTEQLQLIGQPREMGEEIYPSDFAEMSEPTIFRGFRLVRITTYPVQYNPATHEYLVRDRIDAELRFTNDPPINPAEHPDRRYRSEDALKVLDALAINARDALRDSYGDEPAPYVGHYAVVTHADALEYAAPFIEWRRKSGYKMDILNISSGNSSNTTTIKRTIKDKYEDYTDADEDPFDLVMLIGDRSGYSNYAGSPGWQLAAPTGTSTWGDPPHDDWDYACLEGNDRTADVGISRWCSGSEDQMDLFSYRTLMYEATPDMDNTDWMIRGGAWSQDWGNTPLQAWHVTINLNARWAFEVLQQHGMDSSRFYEKFEYDQEGVYSVPFETALYNDGASLLLGRSENYAFYHAGAVGNLDDQTVFPLRIVTSGHGEWICWALLRYGATTGNVHYVGPVASTCGWGGPGTIPMTIVWLEMVNGIVQRDLPLGWGRVLGSLAPEAYFPNFATTYAYTKTDVDCYGDPGIKPWLGVPRLVEAEAPEKIATNARSMEVYVHAEDDADTPVPDARVTLYANGDMPEPDDNDYATYADMFMMTATTGEDGKIRFVFPEGTEFVDEDTMFVTVTGRQIRPYFGETIIGEPDRSVELVSYTLEEVDGNGDDAVNPGESWSVGLTAVNNGNEDLSDISATIISRSPYLEVTGDSSYFGDIASGGEAQGDSAFEFETTPDCPEGESRPGIRPELLVAFTDGEEIWHSVIRLSPVAADLEVQSVVDGPIVNAGERNINLIVKNIGSIESPDVDVRLVTLGIGINVINATSRLDGLQSGSDSRLDGDLFRVTANTTVVPGIMNPMALLFSRDGNVIDSSYFYLQVREIGEHTPLGPDKYGYVCYDDTDTDWDLAPECSWIEISTQEQDRDYDGTPLEFTGVMPRGQYEPAGYVGESFVVPLGFVTQFYGQEYDSISICNNGFVCPGDQPLITNYNNWPIERGIGGGAGMIAPFWDDLCFNDNAGSAIYYYYDEGNARFIVEWYKMRHVTNRNEVDLTFQVIIFDKRYWITVTHDPSIVFQYKSISNVSNIRQGDQEWVNNTPYASVGISSPDGTTGIRYSWNGDYPVNAAELANNRAILFATSSQNFKAGFLHGTVTDFATGEPMEGVSVYTSYGFTGETDRNGYWFINDALADAVFSLTSSKIYYNDSTLTGLQIAEDETLEVNFGMLHPEILPSTQLISAVVDSGLSREIPFDVSNTGNGPLEWRVERRLPRNADVDPWVRRLSYNCGDELRDSRINGVAFTGDKFYVTGGDNDDAPNDSINYVYVLDREGQLTDMFVQPCSTHYGMCDIDWDGDLLWGSGDHNVYGFTTEGDVESVWEGPFRINQAIAWDSDRELLWIATIVGNQIIGCNRNGNRMAELNQDDFRIRGLAYWPEDPDGYNLYIFNSPDLNAQVVHKMNTITGDTMYVTTLRPDSGGSPAGCYITNKFDVYSWVFLAISDKADRDRLEVWQVAARRDWFLVDLVNVAGRNPAISGVIDAGTTQDFALTFRTIDLPKIPFEAFLLYKHNATPGETRIDLALEVIGDTTATPFWLLTPENGVTLDTLGMTLFGWEQSVDFNMGDTLRYDLYFQSGDSIIALTGLNDNTLQLNTADNPLFEQSSVPIIWWVQAISGRDTVECLERFTFWTPFNEAPGSDVIPVEFGIRAIYPSPFNTMTGITIGVDRKDEVKLLVYDMQGRKVADLVNGVQNVGYHKVVWNAGAIPSGVYVVRLESNHRIRTAKIALVR
jgi:hypothetical protein